MAFVIDSATNGLSVLFSTIVFYIFGVYSVFENASESPQFFQQFDAIRTGLCQGVIKAYSLLYVRSRGSSFFPPAALFHKTEPGELHL